MGETKCTDKISHSIYATDQIKRQLSIVPKNIAGTYSVYFEQASGMHTLK